MNVLVLGLGNDLIADDGMGIYAVRELKRLGINQVDIVESSAAGIALLEVFIGYDKALIIDAIKTGDCPPGTIQEWQLEDLSEVVAPSPHYAGLPELLALSKRMNLDYPNEFAIFSVEAEDPYTIGKGLSESILNALPQLLVLVRQRIDGWLGVEQDLSAHI